MLLIRTTLFLGCALCLVAQTDEEYGGPAILSRGESPSMASPAPISFRPFIGVNGIYDYGMVPVSVTSTGRIPTADVFGVQANLGLYGSHSWKRTTVGLNYRGDFRHYSQRTYFDGTDHLLALNVTHRPSKHVQFGLRTAAGTYSQSYFLTSILGVVDPNYLQVPQNDIFDNRVIFVSTSADLTYRMSARTSFNMGGEGDLVRRRSTALYGVTTGSAHADMQYRASRHSTLGVDYRFLHFGYTRGFGSANIHSVGVDYSMRLSRHVQLSARVGGARIESLSLASVPLDPVVAAILGQSFALQTAYRISYAPDVSVRLVDTLQRSTFSVGYNNGVNPGNGVYLTSKAESVSASYSYTGVRYWNFGIDASYGRMSALLQTLGTYTSYGAGAGVTRELGKGFHSVLRLEARHYNVAGRQFIHNEYRATLGVTFSPGDVPLALW